MQQQEGDHELQLEIAYVLFIDIVGYSKLKTAEQHGLIELLNRIVRGSEHFRKAEANHRIVTVPSGDGMALVFYNTPEAPVECALEISNAVKEHPELNLRMGIHSGPVSGVIDVGGHANIAGAGINMAQRVMDCGDAGHILVSKHFAEDLEHYGHRKRHLHDLGELEVKHGVRLAVVNLYTEDHGNPELPQKIRSARNKTLVGRDSVEPREKKRSSWMAATAALLLAALVIGGVLWSRNRAPSAGSAPSSLGPAGSSPTAAAAISNKSVAVLPFENLSENKENAFFADGVQDEILTNLAKVADLKVISRTSVNGYRDTQGRNLRKIGEELGVAHVVEGSVQRAGNKVRVNAQLIDARNDAHTWAQTYDRDLADVFAIQSEIAKAIAEQLQAKLSPNEKNAIEERPTADIAAFDEYSRAKTLLLTTGFSVSQRTNYLQAIDILNSAIARDPSFFEAYCQLVYAHDSIYALGSDHTPARLAQAETAIQGAARLAQAETAIQGAARLRPNAAETHLARASHLYFGLRDYKAALAELEIARRGLANDPRIFELTGYILRRQGKHEEGLRDLKRSVELDPRNQFTLTQLALSYQFLYRWADMAAVLDRASAIAPDDIETRSQRAFVDLMWKADPRPLHQAVERLRAEQPASMPRFADNWFLCTLAERDWAGAEQALAALGDNPFFWGDGTLLLRRHFGEGLLARAMHDDAKAAKAFAAARLEQEQVVTKQKDYGPALCVLALIDAGLGKKELALEEGKRAIALMPLEKDSINAERMQIYFAIIAAWVGEKDLAFEKFALAGHTPGACLIANYGSLKLWPFWDPLRGDPRFEKIVNSLAPK